MHEEALRETPLGLSDPSSDDRWSEDRANRADRCHDAV